MKKFLKIFGISIAVGILAPIAMGLVMLAVFGMECFVQWGFAEYSWDNLRLKAPELLRIISLVGFFATWMIAIICVVSEAINDDYYH